MKLGIVGLPNVGKSTGRKTEIIGGFLPIKKSNTCCN